MTAIDIDDCTVYKDILPSGLINLTVITPATADDADTIAITMANYGMTTFIKCVGSYQSTADSIAVEVAFTTAVSSGTLTVTLDSTAGSNKVRIAEVKGKSV